MLWKPSGIELFQSAVLFLLSSGLPISRLLETMPLRRVQSCRMSKGSILYDTAKTIYGHHQMFLRKSSAEIPTVRVFYCIWPYMVRPKKGVHFVRYDEKLLVVVLKQAPGPCGKKGSTIQTRKSTIQYLVWYINKVISSYKILYLLNSTSYEPGRRFLSITYQLTLLLPPTNSINHVPLQHSVCESEIRMDFCGCFCGIISWSSSRDEQYEPASTTVFGQGY